MTLERNLEYREQDLSSSDLEISAGSYEGYVVKDLAVDNGASNLVARLIQEGETKTGIPVDDGEDEILPWVREETNSYSTLNYLQEKFADVPAYKVPPDTELVLTSGGSTGTAHALLERYSEDQAPRRGEPGTSGGMPTLFFSVGEAQITGIGTTTTETGYAETSLNPSGVRDFPFEESIPSGWEVDLLGLATCKDADSGADISYDGLRIWYEETSQLGAEENWVDPAPYNYPTGGANRPLLTFPTPVSFTGPEDIRTEVKVTNSSTASAEDAYINFCYVFLIRSRG